MKKAYYTTYGGNGRQFANLIAVQRLEGVSKVRCSALRRLGFHATTSSPRLGAGIRDAGGASGPDEHRRFGDAPPSPWPPKRDRIGSGSSLRDLGDAAKDRGSGEVGRFASQRSHDRHALPSRDRSVETLQTRYETRGRPRGRRGVSGAAMWLRCTPTSSVANPERRCVEGWHSGLAGKAVSEGLFSVSPTQDDRQAVPGHFFVDYAEIG